MEAGRAEMMPEGLISGCPACGGAAAEQSLEVGPGDKVLRTEGSIGPFDGEQPPESAETRDAGGSLRTPGSQARESGSGLDSCADKLAGAVRELCCVGENRYFRANK